MESSSCKVPPSDPIRQFFHAEQEKSFCMANGIGRGETGDDCEKQGHDQRD